MSLALSWWVLQGGHVPEGFTAAFGKTVSLTGPVGFFSWNIDPNYNFFMERILARWPNQSASNQFPMIQLFRDAGQRAYFSPPSDIRTLANPGEAQTVARGLRYHGEPQGILFEAGAIIQGQISGYTADDPASIHLVIHGRMIRKQEGAW